MAQTPPPGLYFLLVYFKLGQPKFRVLGESGCSSETDDDPKDPFFADQAPNLKYSGDPHNVLIAFDQEIDAAGATQLSKLDFEVISTRAIARKEPMWHMLQRAETDQSLREMFYNHLKQSLYGYCEKRNSTIVPFIRPVLDLP